MKTSFIIRRSDNEFTFNDRVFESEINLKIKESGDFYDKLLFKEALRTSFFELQAARDKYRELSILEGMHIKLILRFIEVQALLLCPICPHVSEHVWGLLGKVKSKYPPINYVNNKLFYFQKSSIVKSNWPPVGNIDEVLIKASEYLMSAAHSFRVILKNHLLPPKAGKANPNPVAPEKPTVATVWVAKTFPSWQSCILTIMKSFFEVSKHVFSFI